ncbi:MAG: endolytic transglycosylase MltG [Candidatus Paceibacterota bacterium]|jgi:UPF0755 protein
METLSRFVATVRLACTPSSKAWLAAFVLAVLLVVGYGASFAPPRDFPSGSTLRVVRGASVPEIADDLSTSHIIAHPLLLRAVLRATGASGSVQPGVYLFAKPENLFVVAYRLVAGAYGLPPVRLTFIEGVTVREAGAQIAAAFADVSANEFVAKAGLQEGYLFPDTYFFQPSADTDIIIETMHSNFEAKIAPLSDNVRASGHSLSDIVIMASLIEKEARSTEARRMVAGILWNRLNRGMPLQVDAVFGYIFNRDTYSPSYADLKVDSPYNTYTHKGLPPSPICNPGLDALQAALNPAQTSYLYYLTGKDNQMHYAKTYAEHQTNRQKYLR